MVCYVEAVTSYYCIKFGNLMQFVTKDLWENSFQDFVDVNCVKCATGNPVPVTFFHSGSGSGCKLAGSVRLIE